MLCFAGFRMSLVRVVLFFLWVLLMSLNLSKTESVPSHFCSAVVIFSFGFYCDSCFVSSLFVFCPSTESSLYASIWISWSFESSVFLSRIWLRLYWVLYWVCGIEFSWVLLAESLLPESNGEFRGCWFCRAVLFEF